MKKDLYLRDLKDIQNMAGQIRTLSESIRFGEEFDDEMGHEEGFEPMEADKDCADGNCNIDKANPEDLGMEELEKGGELDKIREITLKGMIQLNKTPEDPKFQALLKIFNICNKAVNDNSQENEA